jgi:hypothetical protein
VGGEAVTSAPSRDGPLRPPAATWTTVVFGSACLVALSCAAAPTETPASAHGEAERDVFAVVPSLCASGGEAVELQLTTPVDLAGVAAPWRGELWLRASCRSREPVRVVVERDGVVVATVELADTLHRERFEWTRGPVLDAAPSDAQLTLSQQSEGVVRVDQWALLAANGAAARTPDPSWSPLVWRSDDGSLELRAATGAKVFDPEWVAKLAREQRDAVAELLGARLARPVVLVAVPAAEWPDATTGALQNGCAILLRDDELHLPWRSYAHEIAHLHEDELGLDLPWFLSEGIAGAVALAVEARLYEHGGARESKERALDQLLERGDGRFRPGVDAANPALARADERPDDERRDAAYAWSTALLRAVARRGGADFWPRLRRELATPAARSQLARGAADRVGAARAALERAAGVPLGDLFARAGVGAAGKS